MIHTDTRTRETLLKLIHFAVAHEIRRDEILDAVSIETVIEPTARGLVLQLHAAVLGRQDRRVYRYPATWWDAFKARWFRGVFAWALKRWPPAFVEFSCETTELFPDLKPMPGQRSVLLRTIEGEALRVR